LTSFKLVVKSAVLVFWRFSEHKDSVGQLQ